MTVTSLGDVLFGFDVSWDIEAASNPADAGWGKVTARVAGDVVWPSVHWSWTQLVQHLAEVWPWLAGEDGWPVGFEPRDPTEYASALRDIQDDTPEHDWPQVEADLFDFRYRHDLSKALAGVWPKPFWLVREGNLAWVAGPERATRLRADQALATLSALGDTIVARLRQFEDEASADVVSDWDARRAVDADVLLEIETRLPLDRLREVAADEDVREVFLVPELRAVARMTGALGADVVRSTMLHARNLSQHTAPKLDRETEAARRQVPILETLARPYEEGRVLAGWLRDRRHAGQGRVDPEALLGELGIEVRDIELPTSRLNAVACWGPQLGPAVLVNRAGLNAKTERGRRATLAHELCHLLVDRDRALPFAEVFGGHVPRRPEQRANAFAAELLLPCAVAGAAFAAGGRPEGVLKRLCDKYGVSHQLAAWQALSSDRQFDPTTRELLMAKADR